MSRFDEEPDGDPHGECAAEIRRLNTEVHQLRAQCNGLYARNMGLQARVDALMMEFCPDEMTPEQLAEWARYQVPVSADEQARVDALLGTESAPQPADQQPDQPTTQASSI